MKKHLISKMLTLLLAVAFLTTAAFASGGTLDFSVSQTEITPNDTVSISVSTPADATFAGVQVEVSYPSNLLEIVSTSSALDSNPTDTGSSVIAAGFVMDDTLYPAGTELLSATFKVKDGVTSGSGEIAVTTCTLGILATGGSVDFALPGAQTVTIAEQQAHTHSAPPAGSPDWVIDATSHSYTCSCRETITSAHTYDNADDAICNDCGYKRNIQPDSSPVDPVTAYAINIDTVTGGTVTSDVSYAEAGETVVLTATPDKYYKLESLTVTDSYGNELDLSGFYQDYSFTMPACDVTVTAVFKIVNPFTDNPEGTYYYDAVLWAYVNDITTGTTATTFSPEKVCTRAQFVTFLWRAAGCPEVKNTTTTNFTDVDANAYYAKAVLWAVEKGITTGTTATTFSPDAAVTRAQVVTFLWRYAGSPILAENNTFTDVEANAYYTEAVKWAAKNGITTGTTATTFSPYASCTRAQVVTFLYRWFGK